MIVAGGILTQKTPTVAKAKVDKQRGTEGTAGLTTNDTNDTNEEDRRRGQETEGRGQEQPFSRKGAETPREEYLDRINRIFRMGEQPGN